MQAVPAFHDNSPHFPRSGTGRAALLPAVSRGLAQQGGEGKWRRSQGNSTSAWECGAGWLPAGEGRALGAPEGSREVEEEMVVMVQTRQRGRGADPMLQPLPPCLPPPPPGFPAHGSFPCFHLKLWTPNSHSLLKACHGSPVPSGCSWPHQTQKFKFNSRWLAVPSVHLSRAFLTPLELAPGPTGLLGWPPCSHSTQQPEAYKPDGVTPLCPPNMQCKTHAPHPPFKDLKAARGLTLPVASRSLPILHLPSAGSS